jgi:hypothetical protein
MRGGTRRIWLAGAGRGIGWMSGIRIGSAISVSSSPGGGERGWR